MLTGLRISNFAVIDEVEITLGSGLSVLTGETGAGKSIVVDAFSILLGSRFEAELVKSGREEATIEGVLRSDQVLRDRLAALGLPDLGDEISLRRVMSRAGRGKVYINGALVTVGVLAKLMQGLVDIAGQHEHMALIDVSTHRGILDRQGIDPSVVADYAGHWESLDQARRKLAEAQRDPDQALGRIDFLKFQIQELNDAALLPDEITLLEATLKKLQSSEKRLQYTTEAESLLGSDEGSALDKLGRGLTLVTDAMKFDPGLKAVVEALKRGQAEVEEGARELARYLGRIESDPSQLATVEDRVDLLKRLARRHGVASEGLVVRLDQLRAELSLLEDVHLNLEAFVQRCRELEAAAIDSSQALSAVRRRAGELFGAEVQRHLTQLALGRCRFEVRVTPGPLGPFGADAVEFYFSANPGEPSRPLAKVVSGGEASRIVLALKRSSMGADHTLCSVFDEADAGVGGAVAEVIGRTMREVSRERQVICITHHPQVAAYADSHFAIEKLQGKDSTASTVTRLVSEEDRVREVARMLSGVTLTSAALEAARTLIAAAQGHPLAEPAKKKVQRKSAAPHRYLALGTNVT